MLTSRIDFYGYNSKDITALIDADGTPREQWPTRHNIVSISILSPIVASSNSKVLKITAMQALVEGRRRGDHVVFMCRAEPPIR